MDELLNEMYADIEATAAKYSDKYMEITGILESAEINDASNPPGKTVWMKTTVEAPYENGWAMVLAVSWDDEWITQEAFEEIAETLAEDDEVVLRGYAPDYAFYDDGGIRQCGLDLIGIRKK